MERANTDIEFLWTDRIMAEYREMPGLSLTAAQASRLWGLELSQCHLLLEALVASGYLRRAAQSTYVLDGGAGGR